MGTACAICKVQACREALGDKRYPAFCAMVQAPETLACVRRAYDEEENHLLALAVALYTSHSYYSRLKASQSSQPR